MCGSRLERLLLTAIFAVGAVCQVKAGQEVVASGMILQSGSGGTVLVDIDLDGLNDFQFDESLLFSGDVPASSAVASFMITPLQSQHALRIGDDVGAFVPVLSVGDRVGADPSPYHWGEPAPFSGRVGVIQYERLPGIGPLVEAGRIGPVSGEAVGIRIGSGDSARYGWIGLQVVGEGEGGPGLLVDGWGLAAPGESATVALVPEPSVTGLLILGGLLLRRRLFRA